MNKKKKLILCFSIVLLLIGILAVTLTDERTKILNTLDTDKTDDFYYFKDLPIEFVEYHPPTVFEFDRTISIHEIWKQGENNIENLTFITQFMYLEDISFDGEFTEFQEKNANRLEKVTVLDEKGIYSSTINHNGIFEVIEFVKEGIYYQVLIQHHNEEYLGKEFLTSFINSNMKN